VKQKAEKLAVVLASVAFVPLFRKELRTKGLADEPRKELKNKDL
jgi:hypothetical protein